MLDFRFFWAAIFAQSLSLDNPNEIAGDLPKVTRNPRGRQLLDKYQVEIVSRHHGEGARH